MHIYFHHYFHNNYFTFVFDFEWHYNTLDKKSSHSFLRADDTTELMEEAAQVALCSSQTDSTDSTQALLKTFAWVEPPEEDTFCPDPAEPPHHNREQQLGSKILKNKQPAINIISGG